MSSYQLVELAVASAQRDSFLSYYRLCCRGCTTVLLHLKKKEKQVLSGGIQAFTALL